MLVCWSVSALCEALRRLNFKKLERPLSSYVQFRKWGWHVLVRMRRSLHSSQPPSFLEVVIHYDRIYKFQGRMEPYSEPIMAGDEVELQFSQISLMYSRVVLDWSLEEQSEENMFWRKVAEKIPRF